MRGRPPARRRSSTPSASTRSAGRAGSPSRARTRCRASPSRSTRPPRSAAPATGPGPSRSPTDVLTEQLRTWTRRPRRARRRGLRPGPDARAGAGRRAPLRRRAAAVAAPARAADRAAVRPAPSASSRQTSAALRVAETARAAEAAGFDAVYVMDHFRQIPQVGRAWDDFLESYTTLAYLAACTERVRLGRARHGRHVPQRRAPRQDRGHPRRAQRRACGVRARPWLVRSRSTRRTAGRSPRRPSATRCSRTRSSCCR